MLEQLMHNMIVLNGEEKGNNVRYRCSVHMESNPSCVIVCNLLCVLSQSANALLLQHRLGSWLLCPEHHMIPFKF